MLQASIGVYRKQGTWWIDRYEDGRRRRKKTRGATKTEAKKMLRQSRARIAPGLLDRPPRDQWLDRFIRKFCVGLNLYAMRGSALKATAPVPIWRRVAGFGKGDWPRHKFRSRQVKVSLVGSDSPQRRL